MYGTYYAVYEVLLITKTSFFVGSCYTAVHGKYRQPTKKMVLVVVVVVEGTVEDRNTWCRLVGCLDFNFWVSMALVI